MFNSSSSTSRFVRDLCSCTILPCFKVFIHTSKKITNMKNCHCLSNHEIYNSWGNKSYSGERGRFLSKSLFLLFGHFKGLLFLGRYCYIVNKQRYDSMTRERQEFHFPVSWKMVLLRRQGILHRHWSLCDEKHNANFLAEIFLDVWKRVYLDKSHYSWI